MSIRMGMCTALITFSGLALAACGGKDRTGEDIVDAGDQSSTPDGCVPFCGEDGEAQCGDDGCGGSCGTCPAGNGCADNGKCECIPDCTGKECGSDGCAGICGKCGYDEYGMGQICAYEGLCFPADGEPGCSDVLFCIRNCLLHDEECAQSCINGGTIESSLSYSDWMQCVEELEPTRDECLWGSQQEKSACYDAAKGICPEQLLECNHGYDGCHGIWECIEALEGGLNDDMVPCLVQGTEDSQKLMWDLMDCVGLLCESPADTCVAEALESDCAPQFEACLAGY